MSQGVSRIERCNRFCTLFGPFSPLFPDALTFIKLCFRHTTTVAAENLFLRKQLGLFIDRKAKSRRATDAIRFTLALSSANIPFVL